MTVTIEASPSRWRYVAALSALLAVLGAASLLTVDPGALAQARLALGTASWLLLPYVVVIFLGVTRRSRATGWLAIVLGSLFWLVVAAAVLLTDGDALAFAAYSAAAIGLQTSFVLLAHAGLLTAGIRLVRGADGPASLSLFVLATASLAAAGITVVQAQRYRDSPQRAQQTAVQRAVDARGAILQLHRCLVKYRRARGTFPAALTDLGPAGSRCAEAIIVDDGIAGFRLRYEVSTDGQQYALVALAQDPARSPYDHRRVDESGTVWHGLDTAGANGTPDEDPTTTIQTLDICIEQYRLRFPQRGYPASIAIADRQLGCFFPGGSTTLAEVGRSILEIGEFMGYRYVYRAAPPDSAGVMRAFRLDLRPVAWGRPLKRSYLCTPQGTLHLTSEDRAAEVTDPDLQTDTVTGFVNRSWCMGPDVPARR